MGHKTHHEHLLEEKESASQTLKKAVDQEKDKALIYLDDHYHTILMIDRSKVKAKLSKLKKQGLKIKRVL